VKFVTYWETPSGGRMPPYVAMSLVSLKRALGEEFVLLGPGDVTAAIGFDLATRDWNFEHLEFSGAPAALSIVAKSDFIRMAYVSRNGGFWLDADTIAVADPRPALVPAACDTCLQWFNEALFGAHAGNRLLQQAVSSGWIKERHTWGNPGGIRDLVEALPDQVAAIDGSLLDPGWRGPYRFATCEVMYDRDLPVEAFLTNPKLRLLKLYNTYFSRSAIGSMDVAAFLRSGTLLSRIFLHLSPDIDKWTSDCCELEASLRG